MSVNLLREIADWKLEAKLEDTERYFFHTADVDRISNGSRCYVIGRKGTGKTAISEHLYRVEEEDKYAAKLTFKNFPFNDLYKLSDSQFTAPNQYITLWKFVIYSSIAKKMMNNHRIDSSIRVKLNKVYGDDPENSLSRTISKWTGRAFDLKILGTGFGSNLTRSTNVNDTPLIDRVNILENLIRYSIDDSQYLIVFDELDEDYQGITALDNHYNYDALLTGLFKAVQDVRSIFPVKEYKIFPIVFLRDDIYEIIKDSDKTKWSDMSVELEWNTDKIKNLLAFRISRAINEDGPILSFIEAWNSVFLNQQVAYGGRQKKRISSFDFMTRGTVIRPRDYIRYMQVCAEATIDTNHSRVGPRTIVHVDKEFSNYLREELQNEIRGIVPEIEQIFSILSHMKKQIFSVEEFTRAYNEEGLLNNSRAGMNAETILKILFHFSVIGNHPRQVTAAQVFKYQNKAARLNFKEGICVHRGLYKALQLI